MDGAAAPDEKLERLLFVEENAIGIENKRQLATVVIPLLTAASFETYFMNGKTPPLARMQRLAQLQGRVRRTGFQDAQREEIADHLDRVACLLEARARVFESVDAKPVSPVDKATTMLKLCTGNMLTEGRLSTKARDLIVSYLSRPGFLTGYMAHTAVNGEMPNADDAMARLMETLGKAGINPETSLKSIAA